MANIGNILLGVASGAAGAINKDAEANREFMRKHRAKVNESAMIRQEKAHDAKKARWNDVNKHGTGDTGVFIYAKQVLGSAEAAEKAMTDPAFVASVRNSLEKVQDPGELVLDTVGMSKEEHAAQFGTDTLATKLLGKFGVVRDRRRGFREDQENGRQADVDADAAMAPKVTAPVLDVATDAAPFEEGKLGPAIAPTVEPLELQGSPIDMMLDGKPTKLGISKGGKWVYNGEEVDASRVGNVEEGLDLDAAVEVMYQGKKQFANQDQNGKWRIDGKELEPDSVTPLDDKPSSRVEQINMLRAVNLKINATNDPVELAMLEDERAVLLGATSAASLKRAEARSNRELGITDKLASFDIAEADTTTLAKTITSEMGGPNAFIDKWTDNLDSYITGVFGSKTTPQDIMTAYSDIEGTTAEKQARYDKISNAYKTGNAEFIFETLKYNIANMLKEGQKLSTYDNKKVDDMFGATWGTDQFAGKLSAALRMIAQQKDRQVFNIMHGRNINKADIVPVTVKGVREYWYPAPDGNLQKFVY